LPEKKISPLKL